ncbi:hypothetical protein E2986_12494 [Frieseomelitta varia]|uniref:Uncharacterized protein n=1 Tax=Frieseomelitta varia TaxID=561572 RepID=A0A833RZ81_9HYME|nr:hypothetical protein E2986_12494 [Frieseomelitta varia]
MCFVQLNGAHKEVLLFPEEGWARSASSSYWTLTPFWWSRSRCKVVEVAGTRRYSTQAKMVDTGTGTLYIIGSFKRMTTDPDFKLYLTSNVSSSDFNMGYSMTGTLERGCKKTNTFQMTHFAVIRRRDYEKAYEDSNPTYRQRRAMRQDTRNCDRLALILRNCSSRGQVSSKTSTASRKSQKIRNAITWSNHYTDAFRGIVTPFVNHDNTITPKNTKMI